MIVDYIEITKNGALNRTLYGPWVINPLEKLILGPFTMNFTYKCYHYLDCHTYAYGELYDNYAHPIWVTIKEDINYDCKVDLKDVYAAGKAYGSYPGHPKWDARCDVFYDRKIDLKDYYNICKKYGF
jgi:hypothetical protein